jgi:carboxypeptidase Q
MEEVLERLVGAALLSDGAWEDVVHLADVVGPRLAGSAGLDRAVAWGEERLRGAGLVARREEVMVPRWVRGQESLAVLAPVERSLPLLGLGGTVGTPPEGIEGDVVVVDSFEHLDSIGESGIRGKIVLFDVPFTDYGETVQYRIGGPSRAAKLGASAMLLRSVTPTSLQTPHTGTLIYSDEAPRIPAAAITLEDAAWMRRRAERGEAVRARLRLGATKEGDVPSANVVADLPGRERAEEVVLLGCHLDSWDVTPGAQDDAAGCGIVMDAARLIARLPVRPRRSVRVVLFANEENGGRGGKGYAEKHASEAAQHVAVYEADAGAGRPLGLRVAAHGGDEDPTSVGELLALRNAMEPVLRVLRALGAPEFEAGGSGVDVDPMVERGVIGFGLSQDMSAYWPVHHTIADTPDKIDREHLRHCVAVTAALAWYLAEREEPLARALPPR